MAEKRPFRVVIVGGSVAGLSLANMLQLIGIDYVILEAYPHVAPQVGASIGLLPHGNRILDQLGLFTKILSMAPPVKQFNFRNKLGATLAEVEGMTQSFVGRHGYSILFLDRQTVLQVMYENLKDKSKVLTQKRVSRIERDDDGITAITTDESSYRGDIVVGADGIHSTVRSEMWRIADELSPGYMSSKEPTAATCDYGCIFGISKPCNGIEPGCLHSIFRENSSYLVNGGPQHRVYWFYFFKLPKTAHGSEIPRFTKEDEAKLLEERADDNILPDLKFRTLFENKITTNMTSLPEHVYDNWHYDRMITIGDSAHKFNPIAGHGGNAAIESAATLVNGLCKALKKSSTGSLTTKEVHATFARVQEIRKEKAKICMKASHDQQQQEALENVAKKLVAFYLLPVSDKEDILFNFSSNIPNSEKLDMIELKRNPKLVPFKDELATAPKRRGVHGWSLMAFYLACSAFCHYGMWIRSAHYGLGEQFESILTTGIFPLDSTFPLKRTYIGVSSIDNYLTFLSAAYMTGLKGWSRPFATLQLYFLGMLVAPIAIWAVESCRKRNSMTVVSTIIIWLTLTQWGGVGIYMPLYYVCYTYISDVEPYWWPLSRAVPLHYAKALLPAILIGYVTPTVLMFIPWSDPNTVQNFEALWQVCPMLVPTFTVIGGMIYTRLEPQTGTPMPKESYEEYDDVPYLKRIYLVAFACGVLLHVGVLSQIILSTDPDVTIASVFGPNFRAEPKTMGEGLRALFMADFWAFWIASYVWCASAVWDLKRVGRTNADVGKSAALIALPNIVVGPGAAMAGTWYWRERAMARTGLTKKGDA